MEGYRNIAAATVKRAFYDYVATSRRVYALKHPDESEVTRKESQAIIAYGGSDRAYLDIILGRELDALAEIEDFVNGEDFEMFAKDISPKMFFEVAEVHLQKWLSGEQPVANPLRYKDD